MATGSRDPRLPSNVVGLPGVDIEMIVDELGLGDRSTASEETGVERTTPELLVAPDEPVVFRVRLDLDGVSPPIWRRLDLAGDLTLGRLHDVVQVAMGWTDAHLHAFVMGPGSRDHGVQPFATEADEDEDEAFGERRAHENAVRLDEVLARPGDRLHYDYDFGDGWEHTLTVESVRPREDDAPPARCLAGRRACPPEDVGGPPGYQEVLDALANGTDDSWLREKLAWLPAGFDPAAFDATEVDEGVAAALDSSRDLAALTPETAATVGKLDAAGLRIVIPWCRAAAQASVDVDPALADELTAPWLALLDHVGDGLKLTGAGYLPPSSVTSLIGSLRTGYAAEIMFGKGNREEHVRPIAALRRTATAMGLLRRSKGVLTLTRAGQSCRADPPRLLRHLADRLPMGHHDYELDAGQLVLLAAAADSDASYPDVAELLGAAGWLVDGDAPPRYVAIEWARDTYDVLGLAGWNVKDAGILKHDSRAGLLAVLAVRE